MRTFGCALYPRMTLVPEDRLLVEQLKSGSNTAFERLFLAHYDGLVGYATKYLEDHDQAEEVVQDLFYGLWQKRENLNITSSLASYLFRSARNACLNHLKHLKVRQQYQEHGKREREEEEMQFSDSMETLELAQKIEEVVEQLPEARKKIFKMNRYEGLKYREIAEKLDLSMKTVEGQMSKALSFLRENLKEHMLWFVVVGWHLLKKIIENG